MRQCQTKSSLGNLVCFKTCDLDLRNSLKSMILSYDIYLRSKVQKKYDTKVDYFRKYLEEVSAR